MAKDNPETILLKGMPMIKEGQTDEKLSPGHVVEFGGTKEIQKQATAQQANARKAIALENDLEGKTINDEYAVDALVKYALCYSGCEMYVRVAAAAPAIVKNDKLELKGDGTVRKQTNNGVTFAYALEALDNSTGTKETFIKVEIV